MKTRVDADYRHVRRIEAMHRTPAGTIVNDCVHLAVRGAAFASKPEAISGHGNQRTEGFWPGKGMFVVGYAVRCLSAFPTVVLPGCLIIGSSMLAVRCASADPFCQTPAATGRIRS